MWVLKKVLTRRGIRLSGFDPWIEAVSTIDSEIAGVVDFSIMHNEVFTVATHLLFQNYHLKFVGERSCFPDAIYTTKIISHSQ